MASGQCTMGAPTKVTVCLPKEKVSPLLHLDALVVVHMEAELPHEHEGLFVGDDLHLGVPQQDLLDAGGVIRL